MYARTEPVHPRANSNGLYPLHRVLMENHLGRLLRPDELVHHKNEVKKDNRIENLEVVSRADHTKIHKPQGEFLRKKCAFCKKEILVKPHIYRLRIKRSKNKELFCGRSCGAKKFWESR